MLDKLKDLLEDGLNGILASYPPYDLDLYNNRFEDTTEEVVAPLSPVPARPDQLEFVLPGANIVPNIPDKAESSMFMGKNNCDIYNTKLEYDLDINAITEDSITIHNSFFSLYTDFSPEISGVWRPAFFYRNYRNTADVGNNVITGTNFGVENELEKDLGIENFITLTNPQLKSWTLSGGARLNVDFRLRRNNFLEQTVLGLAFWYRWSDMGRESTVKTYTIDDISQTVSDQVLNQVSYKGKTYKAQHRDVKYPDVTNPVNTERYGLIDGLLEGQNVQINKPDGTSWIYRVTPGHWECLGPKRFVPGLDIFIPDTDFNINFTSDFDRKDYISEDPEEYSYYSLPKAKIFAQDYCRYRNIYNSYFNLQKTEDGIVRSIYDISYSDMQTMLSDGEWPKGQADEGLDEDVSIKKTIDNNIFGDRALDKYGTDHGFFVASKNLIKFLATSPIDDGITQYLFQKQSVESAKKFDLRESNNLVDLRTNLEKIFGNRNVSHYGDDSTKQGIYASSSAFLDSQTNSLILSMEHDKPDNRFTNGFMIRTKKEFLKCLLSIRKENRYISFPKDTESKIISKFSIPESQCRISLDFMHQNTGTGTNSWYKQKFTVAQHRFYTKFKVPDDSEFEPNESESLEMKYLPDGEDTKYKIPVLSYMDYNDYSKGYHGQILDTIYDIYGLSRKFQQKYEIEKNLVLDNGEYYDILFVDNSTKQGNVRLLKDSFYQETKVFNEAVKFEGSKIEEYLNKSSNQQLKDDIELLEQRFSQPVVQRKANKLPDIKEIYFHRIGGVFLPSVNLMTTGKNKFWLKHTGPVNIQDNQYFLPSSIKTKVAALAEAQRKIEIAFHCSNDLFIKLYDLTVTKLRNKDLESGFCEPFPYKIGFRSDSLRVYDQIIGFEFNEQNHILTTRESTPIVAYGGHTKQSIDSLGLTIPGHPKPIKDNLIKSENILPPSAKNSNYYLPKDHADRAGQSMRALWDKSAVKCFFAPMAFSNEIIFTKGFFHPNKGWIHHNIMSPELKERTAVRNINQQNCKEFEGGGTFFDGIAMLEMDALRPLCANNWSPSLNKKIVTRSGYKKLGELLTEVEDSRAVIQAPVFIPIDVDIPNGLVTHLAVKLRNFTHMSPKELRLAIADPLLYRYIIANMIHENLARQIKSFKCSEGAPGQADEVINKITQNIQKEKNYWLGSWQGDRPPMHRWLMLNDTMLNYTDNFDIKFSNFGKTNLKYANHGDTVLPSQSLDFFIGTKTTVGGFYGYGVSRKIDESLKAKTWAVVAENLGDVDEGGACVSLQVCTGCPVPNYESSGIYNKFLYNAESFNQPYNSGYNFIASFRGKEHLLPPINLDAPFSSIDPKYPSRNVGEDIDISLRCLAATTAPRPRETVIQEPEPEPVFLPPAFPSIIGLLTHIAAVNTLVAAGYDYSWGFMAGIYFPNKLLSGRSRQEKVNRYMQNKGYLQIEGTTAEALQLKGPLTELNLTSDAPFGLPNKIQLEIQYQNCLWYTIEADIFRYNAQCSPVLKHKEFNYLQYAPFMDGSPSNPNQNSSQHYVEPVPYPGFEFGITDTSANKIYFDGVRAFYTFSVDDELTIHYEKLVNGNKTKGSYNTKVVDVKLVKDKNKDFEKALCHHTPVSSTSVRLPDEWKNEDPNTLYVETPGTLLEVDETHTLGEGEILLRAHIEKRTVNTASFLLYSDTQTSKYPDTQTITNNEDTVKYIINNIEHPLYSGKWRDISDTSPGQITSQYRKDQLWAEGGLGYGTSLIEPKTHGIIKSDKLITLRDFDYHYGKSSYCGNIKFMPDTDAEEAPSFISYIKFEPRQTHIDSPFPDVKTNPHYLYAENIQNNQVEFDAAIGRKQIKNIKNKIYGHHIMNLSESTANKLNINIADIKETVKLNRNIFDYYLPYYDLHLDSSLFNGNGGKDIRQEVKDSSRGKVILENIMEKRNDVLYDSSYYWISIPHDAKAVLSNSSKIPKAIVHNCDFEASIYKIAEIINCHNICNTSMVGPTWPEGIRPDSSTTRTSSHDLIRWYTPENNFCAGVSYETRETTQSFYMGCGETQKDSATRLDVKQIYSVPKVAHAFLKASELLGGDDITDIKIRFKYLPRKIPTDFRLGLGNNIVNESQLYMWECHKTNDGNIYNKNTIFPTTPPFYQILNEMVFRAWFGERQKITVQDTFNAQSYMQQNHYKWVPYDYDDEGNSIFVSERGYGS